MEKKLVEPSHSPWASPVLVLKKNGKWRLCVDFRKLNDITIKDPKIREIFDALKDAKYFLLLIFLVVTIKFLCGLKIWKRLLLQQNLVITILKLCPLV